jgi:hypothetical protein
VNTALKIGMKVPTRLAAGKNGGGAPDPGLANALLANMSDDEDEDEDEVHANRA